MALVLGVGTGFSSPRAMEVKTANVIENIIAFT